MFLSVYNNLDQIKGESRAERLTRASATCCCCHLAHRSGLCLDFPFQKIKIGRSCLTLSETLFISQDTVKNVFTFGAAELQEIVSQRGRCSNFGEL